MGESHILDDELPRDSAGPALRRAREARGLGLAEIGELTKIPERHLQTIEDGNFAALPARAYAVGFARTYARAVGLDEREVARMVRDELDGAPSDQGIARPNTFDPGDPARIPSSRFALLAAALAVAVIVVGLVFWRNFYSPAAELPPIVADEPAAGTAPPAALPAQAAGGPVVFTAMIPDLWVRLYDADGAPLLERSLNQGERFEVPTDAKAPMLWTAHPEALAITVGGREVPRLAETQQTVKDVPVNAAALLARASAPEPVVQAEPAALARAAEPARRRTVTKPAAPTAREPAPAAAEPAPAPAAPAAQVPPEAR
jgi:cytoskeleton protein RodZ